MATSSSERAAWTTAYINNLADSCFLYIASGGKKDADGKTTPRSLRFFPYKSDSGSVDLPHLRNALARIPQSNLPADVKARVTAKGQRLLQGQNGGRSREEFRAQPLGYELRDDGGDMPTLVGHLAVFGEWAEINSRMEGHFLESIAPGAFAKTIKENQNRMRVLFQHGKDPAIGEKPLGPIRSLKQDDRGIAYEVPLLDTSYNRDLVEMLRADPPVLGSSFRFEVTREDRVQRPKKSSYNPRALPERTVQEVRMSEFGPVTFPAYAGATTGLRSLTDRMLGGPSVAEQRADIPSLHYLMDAWDALEGFKECEDDPDDGPDRDAATAIQKQIEALMPKEATEDESGEPEDDEGEMSSSTTSEDEEGASQGSRTSTLGAGRTTLYAHPARGRRETPLYPSSTQEVPSWRLS